LQYWSGITQCLITNEIAFTVLYILKYKKSFNVFKNIYYLLLAANIPSAFVCVAYICYLTYEIDIALEIARMSYNYMRMFSILVVFVTYLYTVYLVRMITPKISKPSCQVTAIKTLIERLKYYPLANAICRFPLTFYELKFGYDVDVENSSEVMLAFQCMIVVITPLLSVAYLIIFLLMQPHATKHLMYRFTTGKRPIHSTVPPPQMDIAASRQQFLDEIDDISDTYLAKLLDDDASSISSDWKRFDYSTDSGVSFPLLLGEEESLRTNSNM
jgi:hypothetical protein